MYITVSDIAAYLGRDLTATETAKYTQLIEYTKSYMDELIGDLTEADRDFEIDYKCSYVKRGIVEFRIPQVNATVVNSIEGIAYTDGYKIIGPYKNKIQLKELSSYLQQAETDDDYPTFSVNIKTGYAEIPGAVKWAQTLLCVLEASKKSGQRLKSYKLGPRSFSFADDSDETVTQINTLLNPYFITTL